MSVNVPLPEEGAPLAGVEMPGAERSAAECALRVAGSVEALPEIFAVRHELSLHELAGLTRDVLAVL